jgi:hypothetical protein
VLTATERRLEVTSSDSMFERPNDTAHVHSNNNNNNNNNTRLVSSKGTPRVSSRESVASYS